MSTISLTNFATIGTDSRGGPLVINGATDARKTGSGLSVTADSIPYRAHLPKIENKKGLLMLYGARDRQLELQARYQEASKLNATLVSAAISIDVGYMHQAVIDIETFEEHGPSMRIANVMRMTERTRDIMCGEFVDWLPAGEGVRELETLSRVQFLGSHPDLMPRLLEETPLFSNIDVLVIPLLDARTASGVRQVALVRPGAKILGVTQGAPEAELILPDWMSPAPDPSPAKRRRLRP